MTRFRWTLNVLRREDQLPGLRAKLRWLWWRHVRFYDLEICHRCGLPVMRTMSSWWHAEDSLWLEGGGPVFGILCPPCFTAEARRNGIRIHWEAVQHVS